MLEEEGPSLERGLLLCEEPNQFGNYRRPSRRNPTKFRNRSYVGSIWINLQSNLKVLFRNGASVSLGVGCVRPSVVKVSLWATCLLLPSAPARKLQAQTVAGVREPGVSALVIDPSGAKIPHAEVLVFLAKNTTGAPVSKAQTDAAGQVSLTLPAGDYMMQVTASGFLKRQQPFRVSPRAVASLTVKLTIETSDETVTVSSDDGTDDNAISNGEALVLRGRKLNALSDNPSTFQQELNALVGGEESPQFRIDGFTGGRLPPKANIREIRINQNAYSAQFDQRGNTVIDIFTKPGTDKLHGFAYATGNTDAFNAPNPFNKGQQPGYHSTYFFGNLNGPLNKNTSFYLGLERGDQQNNAVVNVATLDSDLNQVKVSRAVPNPAVNQSYNLRIDRSFGKNNTFTGRFDFTNAHQINAGVGQLVLESQGYTSESKISTLQLGDTTIVGPHVVVESRFQYRRTRTSQSPVSNAPTVVVQGSFNGGGSSSQLFRDAQDSYEAQEYLSVDHGKHFLRAGARYRLTRDSNSSSAGYNGQYTFTTLGAYQTTLRGLASGQTPAQIRAAGGGASQYFVTAGTPGAVISTGDLGLYFEDEWKLRPSFSLISGLRYETQTAIPDHNDPAPRVGFAWLISRKHGQVPVVQLRGGVGLFYDRFPANNILTAARQNGVLQSSYYIQNPDFYPNAPAPPQLTSLQPTVYQIAPNLRSPYVTSWGLNAERSLAKHGSVGLGFTSERGSHQLLSRNANAPLNGIRPMGGTQNVYQYASEGHSSTKTLFAHGNLQFGNRGGLWASYFLRYRETNTGGLDSFVSNSYDINRDYGRTGFLTRNRGFVGGWFQLPFNVGGGMFLNAHSTTRFNITTGQDNNGDSIFNDRPSFATDLSRPSVVRTTLGDFDTAPIAGQTIIPINYGKAPNFYSLQTQVGRGFNFGPVVPAAAEAPKPKPGAKPAPPDRVYHLYVGLEAQNLLNRVNAATPVGQLSSQYFGQSLTLNNDQTSTTAANRVVNVFMNFNF